MKAAPGDPFSDEKALPKETHEALLQHYGLKDPLYIQYVKYLSSIIRWDLGPSFKYKDLTVNDIIRDGFIVSGILGLEALTIALSFGILIGILSAINQNKYPDFLAMSMATFGISVPSFLIAALLQYTLAFKLGLFPIARWGTMIHTILPALSLAAMPIAFIARLVRANMIEVLYEDYIKTAKSKGLTYPTIILRHCLRNAIAPLMPYFGQLTANILVGSFIIEKIFGIPGLGQWFVISVSSRDYPVIMGTTVFYSIILLSSLLISEIAQGFLDPRIKQSET